MEGGEGRRGGKVMEGGEGREEGKEEGEGREEGKEEGEGKGKWFSSFGKSRTCKNDTTSTPAVKSHNITSLESHQSEMRNTTESMRTSPFPS
jgi:hypothetical protein